MKIDLSAGQQCAREGLFYVESPEWKQQVCEQTLGYLEDSLVWLEADLDTLF